MAKSPSDIRYTKEHEWVRMDGDIATIGITDHAQEQLGDVVFVELPEIGREVAADEACAVVESVKAASDVYAPLSGRVMLLALSGPRAKSGMLRASLLLLAVVNVVV